MKKFILVLLAEALFLLTIATAIGSTEADVAVGTIFLNFTLGMLGTIGLFYLAGKEVR